MLTSPKVGEPIVERWSVGSLHYITWQSPEQETGGKVRIEYSTNGGTLWKTIANHAANTGRYLWRVPDFVSANGRLRISPADAGPQAQARFSIVPSQEVLNYQWINVTATAAKQTKMSP